jgi:hypothetical protein
MASLGPPLFDPLDVATISQACKSFYDIVYPFRIPGESFMARAFT